MSDTQDKSVQILSDITVYMKYARYLKEKKRRETWEEIVDRNKQMHLNKFPELKDDIEEAYKYVYEKKVLPSMRSMQFAGRPIEVNPIRIYNCSYQPIDHPDSFSETMMLLLSGVGVGYSVQTQHVRKLPPIMGVTHPEGRQRKRRYLIGDSIEGWSDAIKVLVESYFYGKRDIDFDFRDIRPKGAELVTSGGKAPGPEPLREALTKIQGVFENAIQERGKGTYLKPIEVHDIQCHIADAVLAGGIRRAAMISLFSFDDHEMRAAKIGNWWEYAPQRGRANNSAVIVRNKVKKKEFFDFWEIVKTSGSGEPGVFFTNDRDGDWGANPCLEVSLRPYQFCNLTETNVSDIDSQEDLNNRVWAASLIGTLQASYTDFHYLRDIWRETTEKEALIGVSMTGVGSGEILKYNLKEAASVVKKVNAEIAEKIGIRSSARTTVVKPAGTTSLTLGTSSGIHGWWDPYYIRTIRVGKNEAIYSYLSKNHPELIEDEIFRPDSISVISVPQKAPEGAIYRHESPIEMLERVKRFNIEWIAEGHRDGVNHNNVSCTVNVKDNEWDDVGNWMWENRKYYTGISVLPYDGGTYKQAPFQTTDEATYKKMYKKLHAIDLTEVIEDQDDTDLSGEIACGPQGCDVSGSKEAEKSSIPKVSVAAMSM
jgi:ribonucleoside-diphosphate reductase alpha chain